MVDWRKSPGHLLFLKEFLKPQNIDNLPTWIDWKLILREEPKAAIQRFLDSGVLVSASLSEHLNLKFKVAELEDMLRNRRLSPSERNKQELILRLIQTHPEDMKQAVMDLTVLKCSEEGEKLVEHFITTEGEPHIRNDISPAEKAKIVAKWILAVASAGVIGNASYDALRRLAEANAPASGLFIELPKSFYNPYEYDAEYILIPGGRYKYSVTNQIESVPDIYFAKYPVTNKCYRRFICYLQDKEPNLAGVLPKPEFDNQMATLISEIEGLSDYMGNSPDGWPEKLRSGYETEKRFNGEDHPVINVSWFDVRAYCCWLSLLETAHSDLPVDKVANLYRLPMELEWEWAASGGKREYPWGDIEPNDKLANYNGNVGATTPVGRYPDGDTPECLMDMAGNVWEWMEKQYTETGTARSLRGGSWSLDENYLRCSVRHLSLPVNRDVNFGFRVVRSQS